ncbi:MAG: hypothetical protein WC044_12760 [Crocinitomicaceae bacterium]
MNTDKRRLAVQNYLRETFQKDSSVYENIAFGKTQTLKPISYKVLDSLYGVKYNLEQKGKRDTELEREILIQRQIALNDTNQLLYIENHLFSLKKKDVLTIYSAALQVNFSNEIKAVDIFETTKIAPVNLDIFKIYTFEESFLHPGYAPLPEESAFYRRYKDRAAELNGDTKDKFVQNALFVMRSAQKVQTLKTTALISEIVRSRILGFERTTAKNELFETMEETYEKINGSEVMTGYAIVYSFKKNSNDLTTTYRYAIKLSPYFEVLSTGLN